MGGGHALARGARSFTVGEEVNRSVPPVKATPLFLLISASSHRNHSRKKRRADFTSPFTKRPLFHAHPNKRKRKKATIRIDRQSGEATTDEVYRKITTSLLAYLNTKANLDIFFNSSVMVVVFWAQG